VPRDSQQLQKGLLLSTFSLLPQPVSKRSEKKLSCIIDYHG
jgi:hypothetical protein